MDQPKSLETPILNSSWIWGSDTGADRYVCFRNTFEMERAAENAAFDISADTDYVAYLNGVEIGRGQFGDSARAKTWNRFAVADVPKGKNVLAVLVFHKGEDFFDYEAGTAGFIACLSAGDSIIRTDDAWRVRTHTAFQSGRRARVTNQMGYTFDYDARKEIDWISVAFDDGDWEGARVVQEGGTGLLYDELMPRPLPQLRSTGLRIPRLLSQGNLLQLDRSASTAENMAGAALVFEFPWQVFSNRELGESFSTPSDEGPMGKVEQYTGVPKNGGALIAKGTALEIRVPRQNTDGRYLIFDLGEEIVGLLEFEIEATAGTILEIAHGEHLDDGRVRAFVGGRCFGDRYICRDGRQRFQMPFRRLAARYLQLHVTGPDAMRIHQFGIRVMEYPTERKGSFVTDDRFARRLHEVSVRTLELCRHEHFEDCPWREQALYAYDSRLQAHFGYYAFGDYAFPKVSFALLGRSADAEGYTPLIAPGQCEVNIPMFSLAWIVAVAEHLLFSGDSGLFREFRPAIERLLETSLARKDAGTGLYRPPEGMQHWHFYEWTPGLAGCIGQKSLDGELHAAYNLHLREALRSFGSLLAAVGETSEPIEQQTRELGESIHRTFWNEREGVYHSTLFPDGKRSGTHELVQALALCEGIVPDAEKGRAMEAITDGKATRCSLSASHYLLKASLNISSASRNHMAERLNHIWEKMLFSGASTMWETENGGNDFDYAASLCHGWASLPVWYHQALVLGVTPLTAGFRKFQLMIFPADHREASGTIPTPHGNLQVSWELLPQGLAITVSGPDVCEPVVRAFEEHPVFSVRYNGNPTAVCAD